MAGETDGRLGSLVTASIRFRWVLVVAVVLAGASAHAESRRGWPHPVAGVETSPGLFGADGRLFKVTGAGDPTKDGQKETYLYDALGRVKVAVRGPLTLSTSWQGGVGTITGGEQPREVVLDGWGRVAKRTSTGPPSNGVTPVGALTGVAFQYDAEGALWGVDETRATGTQHIAFTYNAAHQLEFVSRDGDTVRYEYDTQTGLRSAVTVGGQRQDIGHDGLGRVSSVMQAGATTTVAWEEGGARLKSVSDSTLTQTWDYDERGWLKSTKAWAPGGDPATLTSTPALVQLDYGYDARGNRTSETRTGTASPPTNPTRRFAYDSADRLTGTHEWDGTAYAWRLSDTGQRMQEKRLPGAAQGIALDFDTLAATEARSYRYGSGQLLGVSVTQPPTLGEELTYDVDREGRVWRRTAGTVVATYGWDGESRLVTATVGGQTTDFEYDGLGQRRKAQTMAAGALLDVRTWTWGGEDGETWLGELPSGAAGMQMVMAVGGYRVGSGSTRHAVDAVGSVVASVAGASAPTVRAWGVWGQPMTGMTLAGGPANTESAAGFTGHGWEAALGLTYGQQRWLDGATGQWLSMDPLGPHSRLGSPNGLGVWAYGGLNPTRYTDPDGRCIFASLFGDYSFGQCMADTFSPPAEGPQPDRPLSLPGVSNSSGAARLASLQLNGAACDAACIAALSPGTLYATGDGRYASGSDVVAQWKAANQDAAPAAAWRSRWEGARSSPGKAMLAQDLARHRRDSLSPQQQASLGQWQEGVTKHSYFIENHDNLVGLDKDQFDYSDEVGGHGLVMAWQGQGYDQEQLSLATRFDKGGEGALRFGGKVVDYSTAVFGAMKVMGPRINLLPTAAPEATGGGGGTAVFHRYNSPALAPNGRHVTVEIFDSGGQSLGEFHQLGREGVLGPVNPGFTKGMARSSSAPFSLEFPEAAAGFGEEGFEAGRWKLGTNDCVTGACAIANQGGPAGGQISPRTVRRALGME